MYIFVFKIKKMIKIFKIIAISEGTSYLILLFNLLFNKRFYPELYSIILKPVGLLHGFLFVAYFILAFFIYYQQKWNFKVLAIVQLASIIPFGTFYIENKYLKIN